MAISLDNARASGGALSRGAFLSQDIDLNITPIIDCFVVLIAFVMLSSTFSSIGSLNVGMDAGGAKAASRPQAAVQASVQIGEQGSLTLRVSGKEKSETLLKAVDGTRNYEELGRQIEAIKSRFPDLESVTLVAGNSTDYNAVIETMDSLRKSVKSVRLGGF